MSVKKIDLGIYKSKVNTIYTGRPQGEIVREKIGLDAEDKTGDEVYFLIPDETTSFNPSFYLGLLFQSYKALGIENFSKKYHFTIETADPEKKSVIMENLEDGKRNAINSLSSDGGLKYFLNKSRWVELYYRNPFMLITNMPKGPITLARLDSRYYIIYYRPG